MKRFMLLLFGVFALLLLTGFVSAAACTLPMDTIITLYSESNSHAAVYNNSVIDPSATISICYSKIFGMTYTDADPWVCTGGNNLINLQSITNSHAAQDSSSGYNVNICFGDLSCSVKASCVDPEKEVLALSGTTNAHLAVNSSVSGYTSKLCCSRLTGTVIENVLWEDSTFNKITSAPLSKSVVADAYTRNLNGKTINLKIYNSSNNALLSSFSVVATQSSGIYGNARKQDLLGTLVANKAGIGAYVYFIANYSNSSGFTTSRQSGNLLITDSSIPDSCDASRSLFSVNGESISTFLPNNLCLAGDGESNADRTTHGPGNDCCPTGYSCLRNSTSTGNYTCTGDCSRSYLNLTTSEWNAVERCNDYNLIEGNSAYRESQCRGDCMMVFENEEEHLTAGTFIPGSVSCEWQTENGGYCAVTHQRTNSADPTRPYTCVESVVSDSGCSSSDSERTIRSVIRKTEPVPGSIPIRYQTVSDPAGVCGTGESVVTVPCKRSIVDLPFFGATQVIITLAIIIVIYILITKTRLFGRRVKFKFG